MDVLSAAGQIITTVLILCTGAGWPPATVGAFWAMIAFWGVISVLFDDETPRGIPGLEEIQARMELRREVPHKRPVHRRR